MGEEVVEEKASSENQRKKTGLKRQVNVFSGVGILVGTIIGSGIFMTPNIVAEYSGSTGLLLIVWCVCGLIAFVSAMSYTELSLMMPNSTGAEYDFILETFGDLPAFICAFSNGLVRRPMSLVMISLACGNYILAAADIEDPRYAKLIAAVLIGFIILVNCISLKVGTTIQDIFAVLKVLALIIIAITGVVRLCQGHTSNFQRPFAGTKTDVSDICFSLYGGLFAFAGWNNLATITAELKNPNRDYPRIMWVGMTIVTVCYLSVNVAYLTMMNPATIAGSNAVAVTFGNAVYGSMSWIIPVFVACSTIGSCNGNFIGSSRTLYAISRNGHVPKILAMVHKKRHTPMTSLIFLAIISWLMLIPEATSFSLLLKYTFFIYSAFIAVSMVCLFWLRYKRPDMKRPYKVFLGYPIVALVVAVYSVVAPFYSYPIQSLIATTPLVLSVPLYFMFVRYQILPQFILDFLDLCGMKLKRVNLDYPDDDDVTIGYSQNKEDIEVKMEEVTNHQLKTDESKRSNDTSP